MNSVEPTTLALIRATIRRNTTATSGHTRDDECHLKINLVCSDSLDIGFVILTVEVMYEVMYVNETRRLFPLLIVRLKEKEPTSNSYHYYCPYSYSYEYHHLDDGCEYSDGNFGIEFIRQHSSNRTRLYYC